ncbi:MAG: undecaprenyl-diphosphatase [Bacillota bacterium]|nr:undecaprenyl-diphosphatase [Bacillota bacterium]
MNTEIFRLINNLAHRSTVLDNVMIFFSKYVPYIFMAVIAIVFILGVIKNDEKYRKVSFSTFTITVINLVLSFIMGSIYYVDRPFVHNKVNLLFPHVEDASFPSDHATGTMSIALGLMKYNRVVGIILTTLSIIVGFSRVYVGHHYPSDVVGAYIMVLITNYLYNLVLRNKVEEVYTKVEKLLISKLNFKKTVDGNIIK